MNISPDTFFAALAHNLRLRCLVLLEREGELCVCELTHALGAAQPSVSRHLAQLRESAVVLDRREGLWIHYRLHPELPDWARNILREAAAGLARDPRMAADQKALDTMPGRPGGRCAV